VKGRTNEAPNGNEGEEPYGYWLHVKLPTGRDRHILGRLQLEASEKLNIAPVPHPPRGEVYVGRSIVPTVDSRTGGAPSMGTHAQHAQPQKDQQLRGATYLPKLPGPFGGFQKQPKEVGREVREETRSDGMPGPPLREQ
jgi:hypothetical protein